MAVVKKTLPSSALKKVVRQVEREDLSGFKLSTTLTSPSDSLQDYSILLFGEKKIGKTKLSSLLPDSYFVEAEAGTRGVVHRGDPCNSWRLFRKMLRLLKKDPSKTVVVDTVDMLFKHANDHACAQLGIDHPSEEDWGKGWAAVRNEFTEGMQELMSLGKGVVLISHATEREIKTRSGAKYDRVQPTMPSQARDICEALVDIWAYFHYEGDRRVLTIRGDEHISAGHRLDTRFRWKGREVRNIDMTDSPEQGLMNLVACFNNRYEPSEPEDLEQPDAEDESEAPTLKASKKVSRLKRVV